MRQSQGGFSEPRFLASCEIGQYLWISLVAQMIKNLHAMQDIWVRSLGQEDPLEKENGNPLQYSCLDNSLYRGAWQATVHGVTKSQTQLSD